MASAILLFVLVPILELYLLIEVGQVFGGFTTIMLVLVTGVLGASLVRQQGLSTLAKIQMETAQGRLPAEDMVGGVLLLFAGALLLTPGLLTDAVGFLLVTPTIRRQLSRTLLENVHRMPIQTHIVRTVRYNPSDRPQQRKSFDDQTIDVEARIVDDETKPGS